MTEKVITRPLANGVTLFCCLAFDQKLFEKQYPLSEGMSYNSYVIEDEKTVVLDTVDIRVCGRWLEALDAYFGATGRKPSYLIVQHLEPDHSAGISRFMEAFPECTLLCSAVAARMLPQFCPELDTCRWRALKPGESLDLGSRQLQFIPAPMVHWPEVIVTYDSLSHILFSADAFGTFGTALAEGIASQSADTTALSIGWPDEARRYYTNIVGKYGKQVALLLEKAQGLDIDTLCPLHGPVIELKHFNPIPYYAKWSSCTPENEEDVLIFAASLHGKTVEAAHFLAAMLANCGRKSMVIDLSETDSSEALALAFRYGKIVLMSSTYDGGLVPSMKVLLDRFKSKDLKGRRFAVVENGSWAPVAGQKIIDILVKLKDMEFIGPKVTVRTQLDSESSAAMKQLAENIASL